MLWKFDFYILTDHEIVSAQTAHIFDDHSGNKSFMNVTEHTLKIGAIEICACISVICVVRKIGKTVRFGIASEQRLLMFNAAAFCVNSVIIRKSDL